MFEHLDSVCCPCQSSISIIIIKQSLLHHSVNARLCIYFVSACDYANIPWIWGEDLWDGWWNQHWRLWQHLSQPPVIVYTATSSEESAKQWNWKMQLNFTAHWLCHHELFIKMCNAQRFVTTNQLYQHSCSLSNQPQYNSGACSGMLTSYNIHTTGMQSIESPTYYIMIIIAILIILDNYNYRSFLKHAFTDSWNISADQNQ